MCCFHNIKIQVQPHALRFVTRIILPGCCLSNDKVLVLMPFEASQPASWTNFQWACFSGTGENFAGSRAQFDMSLVTSLVALNQHASEWEVNPLPTDFNAAARQDLLVSSKLARIFSRFYRTCFATDGRTLVVDDHDFPGL